MVIQHNISALNAYRQMGVNNSNTSSNLEKLSSGYRINRAGDDAAGLAISEKMRGQIRGLDMAEQNSENGISLIQTAEGGLNETHAILQRMRELAVQSANGTYDDETDRANLNKEVEALKEEIDRISSSTHYNGIKLLDGSLSSNATSGAGASSGDVNLSTELDGADLLIKDVSATKGTYASTLFEDDDDLAVGETMELTVSLNNGENVTVSLTAKAYTDGTAGGELVGADGTVYGKYAATGTITDEELGAALTASMKNSALANDFKVKDNKDGSFTLTNIEAGADAPQVFKDFNIIVKNADGTVKSEATNVVTSVKGEDAYQTIDASQLTAYDGNDNTVLNINGKKFAILVQDGTDATNDLVKKVMASGLEIITVANPAVDDAGNLAGGLVMDDADALAVTTSTLADDTALINAAKVQGNAIAAALGKALGYNVSFNEAHIESTGDPAAADGETNDVAASFAFKKDTSIDPDTKTKGGLTFQIGANGSADQRVTLSVDDMSSKGIGVDGVSVADQDSANSAIEVIDAAINTVSGTRADLGALQNRLEHTLNNLGTTKENLTAAESSIRDVDMASEMMEFTKNNILVQASQAMLAQANQLPQGVLSLLR